MKRALPLLVVMTLGLLGTPAFPQESDQDDETQADDAAADEPADEKAPTDAAEQAPPASPPAPTEPPLASRTGGGWSPARRPWAIAP